MKRLSYISILACFFMFACDQTKDYLNSLNQAPEINFFDNANVPLLTDSIKLSVKNSQHKYHISLKVTDKNRNIKEVVYSQLAGQGKLFQNEKQIVDNNITISKDSSKLDFDYYPDILGVHQLQLTVRDNFGLSKSVKVQITAFDNLSPVAVFNQSRIGQRDRYEYVIDAKESFDRDLKYGGKIYQYEFTYLGKISYVLEENGHKLMVIFPVDPNQTGTGTGTLVFPVSVRVQDNDGKWSEKVSQDISVN